jgi:hypothetical protein
MIQIYGIELVHLKMKVSGLCDALRIANEHSLCVVRLHLFYFNAINQRVPFCLTLVKRIF